MLSNWFCITRGKSAIALPFLALTSSNSNSYVSPTNRTRTKSQRLFSTSGSWRFNPNNSWCASTGIIIVCSSSEFSSKYPTVAQSPTASVAIEFSFNNLIANLPEILAKDRSTSIDDLPSLANPNSRIAF